MKDWNEKYWDHGKQYGGNGKLINQDHHFAAFFIAGLYHPNLAKVEAVVLDIDNPQDRDLANLALELSQRIRNNTINWDELPSQIYKYIKE